VAARDLLVDFASRRGKLDLPNRVHYTRLEIAEHLGEPVGR
jgi:hypothetical protein